MSPVKFSAEQESLINLPLSGHIFLQGLAGTGKTSAGAARLAALIQNGVPAQSILVLAPQRTLASQYYDTRNRADLPPGGLVDIFTFGGLAQRMAQLFFPLVAEQAGFARIDEPPTFLNIETAQYYMARLVRPLLDKGYFESVAIEPNRIYSQILSNLNLAAGTGFPFAEISERLKAAWTGDPVQLNVYDNVQECASQFRRYCLEHNLMDFSLSLEIFCQRIWPSLLGSQFLFGRFQHLIYDNIEEDFPIAHDVVEQWLPHFDSALLIYDIGGGHRSFLGADPNSAARLAAGCDEIISFQRSFVSTAGLLKFEADLSCALTRRPVDASSETCQSVRVIHRAYFPQMIEWVSKEIAGLVLSRGARPGEITVLAPYLTDSLRFSLVNRLEQFGIPARSHRPSRSLNEEPATRCLLTLAKLAHPGWKLRPTLHDLRSALILSIAGLDLMRADLLTREIYKPAMPPDKQLLSYYNIKPDRQERITHYLCQQYERLYQWIMDYRAGDPVELDIFFSRLFGEILSGLGYGFHENYDAAAMASRLVESVQSFRWATASVPAGSVEAAGLEYVRMVEDGVIGALFLTGWTDQPEDAVFIAPAYTFLVSNRPARFQFWLDIGSSGWWQRLDQPLTHPYVLSRTWPTGARWNSASEREAGLNYLARLSSGLIHRCGEFLYLCSTDVSERGEEQQGQLVTALNQILKQVPDLLEEEDHV